jgi:hypothetical protein
VAGKPSDDKHEEVKTSVTRVYQECNKYESASSYSDSSVEINIQTCSTNGDLYVPCMKMVCSNKRKKLKFNISADQTPIILTSKIRRQMELEKKPKSG